MKNCKTCYEAQTVSTLKKIIQSPPNPKPTPHQIKSYYAFEINFSYGDIKKYTNICFQSASRM